VSAVVSLQAVGKRYVKYDDAPSLLGRAFHVRLRGRTKRSQLWAVRHVDLEVAEGEAVGVIGRNGAGKSTMLRMLAGVTAPSEGVVRVRGRVAPLISVGVGFHPELTGRENVYVNGSVLGLTRRDVDQRFDSIVEFAEIGDFIDTPVKFYSSGMFVRLGFSVAVAARPDVLLVDEVLAVGDFAFQAKCFRRMRELQADGTTMLLVTHNLDAVKGLCSRAMVLHEGTPRFLGPPPDAIAVMHELLVGRDTDHDEAAPVRVVSFELVDVRPPDRTRPSSKSSEVEADLRLSHIESGSHLTFRLRVRFVRTVVRGAFFFSVASEGGVLVYADSTYLDVARTFEEGEEATCDVEFDAPLGNGSFAAEGGVIWGDRRDTRLASRPVAFFVAGRPFVAGVADLGATFCIDGGRENPDSARPPLRELWDEL
jgi:ABC-type polysaccharide/polyol phosphate transport system ATPase subunit